MKSIKNISVVLLLVLVFASCAETNQYQQQANELAQKVIIVDGHIDVPYQLKDEWVDISKAAPGRDVRMSECDHGHLESPAPLDSGASLRSGRCLRRPPSFRTSPLSVPPDVIFQAGRD